MLNGEKLGRAIKSAIVKKGVTQREVAEHFGVAAPSVTGWIKNGRIAKEHLKELFSYFGDTVEPSHWGLDKSASVKSEVIAPRIPLLTNNQAAALAVGEFNASDADEFFTLPVTVAAHVPVKPGTFAIRHESTTMMELLASSVILIDPGREAETGRLGLYATNGAAYIAKNAGYGLQFTAHGAGPAPTPDQSIGMAVMILPSML